MFVTHVTVGKTRKLSAKIFKSLRFSRTLERQLINSVTTELQQLSSVNDQIVVTEFFRRIETKTVSKAISFLISLFEWLILSKKRVRRWPNAP
jgi:hypothetical protein